MESAHCSARKSIFIIQILFIHYFLFIISIFSRFSFHIIISVLCFILRDTFFYSRTFCFYPLFLFCVFFFIFLFLINILPILLMFTNIISFLYSPQRRRLCLHRSAIPRNCSEDKSQRPCSRNVIFCYSERYAQNFIGYSGITVVGNCIRKKAHDKLADVSRCSATRTPSRAMFASQNKRKKGNTWDLSWETVQKIFHFNFVAASTLYSCIYNNIDRPASRTQLNTCTRLRNG